MSGKNLTFKLVMDADTKGFDTGTKASKDKWEAFISVLKKESEELKATSVEASKVIGDIVPDKLIKETKAAKDGLAALSNAAENAGETAKRAGFEIGEAISGDVIQLAENLGSKFFTAAKEIEVLGDKAVLSAGELRSMASAGEQGLTELNRALNAAQAELVRLQSTDGTLKDIEIAKGRVLSIEDAIKEVSSAFNYYQNVAVNAMKGVDGATQSAINQVQRFSSVDLSSVVGEAQTATRAIESIGNGANLSTKEIERIGNVGTRNINTLESELLAAKNAFLALELSSEAVTLDEIKSAGDKVKGLEHAVDLTKAAFSDFNTKASTAMQSVSTITDKASTTAKQAGQAIYSALGIKPPTVINDAIANLSRTLEKFKTNSKMPAEEIARVTRITEQEISRLKSELDGVEASSSKTNIGVGALSKGMGVAKFAVTALVGAMAAVGIGLGVRELTQAADSYTNLSARINIATKDGGDFTSAMAGIHQVALATNSSLDATGSLFTRLNGVGKEMGMTQQNSLDLTKVINQAIQTSGGSAEASEAAVQQLIQAMQGGVLRGEEFNSIMEGGYGVAEALAKGLGVTTGELRKMAENGELGAERVYKALLSQKDAVQQTYDSFPLTVSNALQKIATSWQILIGEVDQANGASATAAQWLSTLADNMMLLKPIIDDIGNGFTRFGEYYSNIYDQGTIDSLKATLISVYDTIKTLFNTVLEVGEAFNDVFSDALSGVLGFTDGLYPAGEQVSGYQKFIDLLNIALGFLSDGFKTIGIGVNLFTGTLYGLVAAWYELKSKLSWGDVKENAIADMEAMRAKSQEYFDKGFEGATKFKSKMLENIDELGKTEQQKNQERITDSQQTLDQLKVQEEKHKTDYKAISDERIRLEQQLFEARKSGNDAAIQLAVGNLAKLDAKEKEYQAESQKITDAKIQAAQDWVNAQLTAADGTQKAADVATQKTLQTTLAAQGLKIEFDSAGKAIVKAMDDGAKATENQGNATDKARKAAVTLKLDLYELKNGITETFNANSKVLSDFANGVKDLGFKGEAAGNAIYQAWLKWLETAKSQNEVDVAMFKLQEFGKTGQMSTKQVEMGMLALRQVILKLPADLDPVEQAFERLGIKTKEQLGLAAQSALADFNTIQASGKATAEGLRQAYERAMQAAAASGDASVIAATNAKAASLGLEVQIDKSGKASVKSMDELTSANDRVRNSAESIGDGYRNAGSVAREEAKSAEQAWSDAVDAASAQFDAEMKRQGKSLSKGIYNYNSYSKAEVIEQIKSKGYSDTEAKKLANNLWQKGREADRDAKNDRVRGGNVSMNFLIKQEFDNAAAKGLTTQWGTNKINDLLRQMESKGSTSAPDVDVNSLAPSVNTAVPSIPTTDVSKNSRIELVSGNKTANLTGSQQDVDIMEEMLREFEMLKKGS